MRRAGKEKSSPGIILMTAIFLVLVIFALVVVTVSMVRQNIHFTRYSHLKTQAYFLAKGAVNLALKKMTDDSDSNWDTENTASNPFEISVGNGKLQAWVTQSPVPDVLYVHGRGIVNRISQDYVVVVKKESVMPVIFARRNTPGPDPLYYQEGGGAWNLIEAVPPRIYWNNKFQKIDKFTGTAPTDSNYLYKIAPHIKEMCSDNRGNLYGSWSKIGPDALYRYSKENGWQPVKPPGKIFYNANGELQDKQSVPAQWLRDFATDGENYLFARYGKGGPDTIYRLDIKNLDTENPKWEVLPPAPCRYYQNKEGTPLKEPDGYANNFSSLCADKNGNLYARYNRDGLDTVYRFPEGLKEATKVGNVGQVGTSADWQWLPPIPKTYYRLENDQYVEYTPSDQYAGNISALSTTPDGTLFGRFNKPGIDTLYRLDVGQKTAAELYSTDWQTVKPANFSYYDENLEDPENEDPPDSNDDDPPEDPDDLKEDKDAFNANQNFKETTMDSDGLLYMRSSVPYHPDSIRTFNNKSFIPGETPEYSILRPMLSQRYRFEEYVNNQNQTVKGFHWVTLERKNSDGVLCKRREQVINEIAGGGKTGAAGKSIYVVISNL